MFCKNHIWGFIILLAFVLLLAACAGPGVVAAPTASLEPALTLLPPTPTPTPEPAAARVNGEIIPLADFEAELGRLQAAEQKLGKNTSLADQQKRVLDSLIDQSLFVQQALKDGFKLDDAALDARIEKLAAEMGGVDALRAWLAANNYTEPGFRRVLWRSLAAAWQRDALLARVPATAEQIHADQIFVRDPDTAASIKSQLDSGADFATLAKTYDPITAGDLGWFPRGYLYQPPVEEAAFKLNPAEISAVVQSDIGYHIVRVIERDPQRVLNPQALRVVQGQALAAWLAQRRVDSQVEILVP